MIFIKYNANFETEMEEGKLYYIFFDKSKTETIFPDPKTVKIYGVEYYYSELLTSVDKEVIPMIYKGKSRINGKRIFEINILSVIRERKINSILAE